MSKDSEVGHAWHIDGHVVLVPPQVHPAGAIVGALRLQRLISQCCIALYIVLLPHFTTHFHDHDMGHIKCRLSLSAPYVRRPPVAPSGVGSRGSHHGGGSNSCR